MSDSQRSIGQGLSWLVACCVCLLAGGAAAAECPQADFFIPLNTGWDQSTGGAVIPIGGADDDWVVTVDASGGTVPQPAQTVTPNPAWVTFPNSQWIAADVTGPNGTYVYEYCWCLDDDFANPVLGFEIRADDQADVYLNGGLLVSLPDGTFNDTIVPTYQFTDPLLFQAGQNCLEVEVENKYGVVTGFNMVGSMSADDALCCDCDPEDIDDNGSTGVDDVSGGLIPSGFDDDEWNVTVSASGGTLPRAAEVIDTFIGWNVIPGTKWISADENGPNGLYVYENCWCMDAGFQNPQLSLELLADDRADVFLNGFPIGSTPATNAFLFPATNLSVSQPALFQAGENCVTIEVQNVSSVVTGLNVAMSFTAENATCCGCVEIPSDAEGWWPLNETVGIVADELLNDHDGFWSEQFGTPPPPTPVPGMVNFGLDLDGIDDYVRIPNAAGLNWDVGENELSIDAWVRTNSIDRQAIVNKKAPFPTDPGYHFGTGGGVLGFIIGDGTNFAICNGSIPINDGIFHFVAVTLDRTSTNGIVLYVDGVIDAICDPTVVSGSMVEPGSLYFGGDPTFPNNDDIYWTGVLDEIEIFRRALSITEINSIFGAGGTGKCPPEACTDSDGIPVCEGECDPGFTCLSIPGPALPICECIPESESCETSGPPTCGGFCDDPDETCAENAVGNCECMLPLCEGMAGFPECNGACPDSDWTCENNGQRCHCEPPVDPGPCETSSFPDCGGSCPTTGDLCEPDFVTLTCKCPDDGDPPLCEGFVTFPECDGWCPPGQDCWNNGQRCHCIDPPHCGDPGDYPTCGLPCPPGYECQQGLANDCICVEDTTACGDTFYPECNGDCPEDELCANIPGTDNCQCVGLVQQCNSSQFPECGGSCPDDETCVVSPAQGCFCQLCVVSVPDPFGPVIYMDKDDKIRWTPVECALTYNLHRLEAPTLRDLDEDGLADDYGDCYQDDIIGLETTDTDKPPPGEAYWYLINAENFNGQNSLGTNSAGQERNATVACP